MNAPLTLASLLYPTWRCPFLRARLLVGCANARDFFASFALERMGVSSDSVGGSHAGYRQSLKRRAMLLYLLVSLSSSA
jgi:hypothetical protein